MANTSNMSSSFFVLIPLLLVCLNLATVCEANRKIHYIHWNKANPMFRLDNTDHIIDVNAGNLPGEYDQVNIICPVSKTDVRMPERHVIYSVSREEFDSCRITLHVHDVLLAVGRLFVPSSFVASLSWCGWFLLVTAM